MKKVRYSKKFCDDIISYFDKQPLLYRYEKTYYSDGSLKSEKPIVSAIDFPTFQGFAYSIGTNTEILKKWCDEHEDFLQSCKMAKMLQEKIWLVNSMNGMYSSRFAWLYGKNCFGYSETSDDEKSDSLKIVFDDKYDN